MINKMAWNVNGTSAYSYHIKSCYIPPIKSYLVYLVIVQGVPPIY